MIDKPLTEKELVNLSIWKDDMLFFKSDVLSAVRLLKKKLSFRLDIHYDGFKINELIDECFQLKNER